MGADAGAAELRVDRAAIGLAGEARTPGQDPATGAATAAPLIRAEQLLIQIGANLEAMFF